jgi:hypothetical protein
VFGSCVLPLTAAQIWALIGLGFGLAGAILSAIAAPRYSTKGGHATLILSDEHAKRARWMGPLGWFCIGLGVVCGVVATLVQSP